VRYTYMAIVAFMLMAGQTKAQEPNPPASQSAPKQSLTPEQIIQQFAQKETEFYDAWMQYVYTQTSVIRVVSVDGRPTKETMKIVSEVVFNDDGTREVRTVRSSGRLKSVGFTQEDEEILKNINPFALTGAELPLYNLKYQGKERADELTCYVFSVKPKSMKKGKLYFQGKIWVDDQDLQIVKTVGKPVPETANNRFPEFETIRQVIDNKYWFPVWTHAEDDLHYPGQVVRIEETITYDDYRKFRTSAKIVPESPTLSEPQESK
jgi:hypothetical protein